MSLLVSSILGLFLNYLEDNSQGTSKQVKEEILAPRLHEGGHLPVLSSQFSTPATTFFSLRLPAMVGLRVAAHRFAEGMSQ
jgi:hypothetical protein